MLFLVIFLAVAMAAVSDAARFDEQFEASWALDHIIYDGELVKLKLDNFSGAGFASKNKYLYGKATAEMKLVEGDSAGTVTAFYMSSDGPKHNEFDFEFLGNTTGEPYLVQTNIYIDGVGNREQRMDLWFDPTAAFHSYSILWNQRQVLFLVDETPIRVYHNREESGIAFPRDQPMGVYSSLWNADDWATQGGRVKTDWSHAPFVTTYRDLQVDGCRFGGQAAQLESEVKRCSGSESGEEGRYWWKEPVMQELSVHQSHQLMWVRTKHLVYDYCADSSRFPTKPPECGR